MPANMNRYPGRNRLIRTILLGWLGLQLLTACGGDEKNSAAATPSAAAESTPVTTMFNYDQAMSRLGARVISICGNSLIEFSGRSGHELAGCNISTTGSLVITIALERLNGTKNVNDVTGIVISQSEPSMPSNGPDPNAWEEGIFKDSNDSHWTAYLEDLHNGKRIDEPGSETPVEAQGVPWSGSPDDVMKECISVANSSFNNLSAARSRPVTPLPEPGVFAVKPQAKTQLAEVA